MIRLAELRKKQKISQKKLGSIIGAAQNTICNWENGSREPDNEMLNKLADYFNVSVDYLLGRVAPKPEFHIGDRINMNEETVKALDAELNDRDRKDISIRLNKLIDEFDGSEALMFDGEPMDEETWELLKASFENTLKLSKVMNKRKRSPKKYKRSDTSGDQ